MLSVDNFEVVYSQIQHKTLTIHIHAYIYSAWLIFLYLPVFIFNVAFRSLIFINFLNALSFDTPSSILATIDCAIYVPHFPTMTPYDDPASIDLIISSFLSIVNATFLCLVFSAIPHTSLKLYSLWPCDYSTCAIKPRLCSDNWGFIESSVQTIDVVLY